MTSTVITKPAATTAALRSQEFPVFIYPLSAPMSYFVLILILWIDNRIARVSPMNGVAVKLTFFRRSIFKTGFAQNS
ncbi:hypothetical protein [Candidatus Binatus sp.]|uniref:hypothetical protein n=1 Tax=Candidatus Binatus sp. TaxID=2811406 RepID=UPI002B46D01E|nr:hypothetical protein [Candidatus Binatus sp.]